MSLTAAMLTGFTGINSNTIAVDTVGNNLANLNTTAFKSQRTLFETLLYQTIDEGDAPSATSGGTLPRQVGTGATVASLQRNFEQGALEGTGFPSDLAVEGAGLFVIEQPNGDRVYTRDGSFRLNAENTMVATNGAALQVFAADATGAVDTGTLTDLVIPLGEMGEATATSEVTMAGQLNSGTDVASAAAVATSGALVTSSGSAATASTQLTDLVDGFGVPLFATGDELSVGGTKGGISVSPSAFVVGTTGSTLGDLASHLEATLGINTDPATGGSPGVTISDGTDAPAGAIVVTSNLGEANAIGLDAGSIVNTTGVIASPLTFTTTATAAGGGSEGASTSFEVFDSLGAPADVRLRIALESKSDAGTTWRFYAESNADSDLSPILGTGTITFDATGKFVSSTGTELTLDRAGEGAATPITFNLDFSGLTGLASPDGQTEYSMATQDGKPAGILSGYGVDADGIVTAVYSNNDSVVLGQVALATFPNYEGMIALSENTYTFGPNSGEVTLAAPQTGSAGAIRSGMLEQGNVEIVREFVNLISASTGVSAASRVVRASDDLLQELLLLAR